MNKQIKKYMKNYEGNSKTDFTSQLSYLRYKDNYPLELKGNMKKKVKINPTKQVKLGSIRTYKSQTNFGINSDIFLGSVLEKSRQAPLIGQKKHYIPVPKLSKNAEFYFRYDKDVPKSLNASQYHKIKHDLEDNINLEHISSLKDSSLNRYSSATNLQQHQGKKHQYRNNMFIESMVSGRQVERNSMRKVNPQRTKSSVKIG